MANPVEIAKNRPAETAMPIATVLAALIAKLLGVEDTDTILYIALVVSFVPAAVTWMVELLRRRSMEQEPVKFEPAEPELVEPIKSESIDSLLDSVLAEGSKPVEPKLVEPDSIEPKLVEPDSTEPKSTKRKSPRSSNRSAKQKPDAS
jgi:hypothetical protein